MLAHEAHSNYCVDRAARESSSCERVVRAPCRTGQGRRVFGAGVIVVWHLRVRTAIGMGMQNGYELCSCSSCSRAPVPLPAQSRPHRQYHRTVPHGSRPANTPTVLQHCCWRAGRLQHSGKSLSAGLSPCRDTRVTLTESTGTERASALSADSLGSGASPRPACQFLPAVGRSLRN